MVTEKILRELWGLCVMFCPQSSDVVFILCRMFATAQKTTELWMWKMEYLHHEQRPLYFGEWF